MSALREEFYTLMRKWKSLARVNRDSTEETEELVGATRDSSESPLSIQRISTFSTGCTITFKVCDVIIDSGSSENVVSSFGKDLTITNNPYPHPYKIWLGKKRG